MTTKATVLMYHYLSARDIEGEDVDYHASFIIQSGDLDYNYKFARDVKGANIEAHRAVIEESQDEFYMELFEELTKEPEQKVLTHTK